MPLNPRYTDLLAGLLPGLGIEEKADAFSRLYDRLIETNEKMNVTSVVDPLGVTLRHFADSLSLFCCEEFRLSLDHSPVLCDVGCGGGFPGLPVALVRPDLAIRMIDSTEKKILALSENAEAMGLGGVQPVWGRAEALAGNGGELRASCGVVFSRAVAPLNVLCEICLPLLRTGGFFFALKGQKGEEEWYASRGAVHTLGGEAVRLDRVKFASPDLVAFSDEERPEIFDYLSREHAIAVVRKTRPTPGAYPRKWAQIVKNPL